MADILMTGICVSVQPFEGHGLMTTRVAKAQMDDSETLGVRNAATMPTPGNISGAGLGGPPQKNAVDVELAVSIA